VFTALGAERDVRVYVGEQLDSRTSIVWAVMRSVLWPMAIALPLLALVGWWAVRQGLAPLRRLSSAIGRREPQALQPVVLVDPPSEMVPLVDALNRLFERIAALLETERRFTADAAHELRTPIAAIRAQAQVALGSNEDRERRHALQTTLQGCDRATHLVEQLLMLSRLEAAPAPTGAALDLSALTRQVVGELAPTALARQQTIGLDAPVACRVRGDVALLGALVRNLVDNAIRYSPDRATVQVGVSGAADQIVLTVQDSGPGLDEAQRKRLGERFFRVLGTAASGSGLGWSIVHRIAATHHADVSVGTSAALGGLSVAVTFPSPDTPPGKGGVTFGSDSRSKAA
jgi:two-component system sensor histidine kinase QseC